MDIQQAFTESKKFLDLQVENFTEKQVEKLGELIQFHIELYHGQQNPIISDGEYDVLLKKLEKLEEMFSAGSLSQTVGLTLTQSNFDKVAHSRPMISLDNTYNEEDLLDFDTRIQRILGNNEALEYMLEFKFDGLGIELIYEEGILIQAITRGNGVVGEDVTQNIMQISNIPKKNR